MAHLVFSSTAVAFLTNISETHKSVSPSVIQVKSWRKTISTEEKLCVTMRCEKDERVVDIHCNVRFAHGIMHKICDSVNRIKESAQPGTKVFVCIARLLQSHQNEPYQKLWMRVFYIFTAFQINNYSV
jgi:hypothetical protein